MSLINNNGQTMRDALKNAMQNSDRLDVLTGYFYLSGFESLDDCLSDIKIRVLVGMEIQPDLILLINSESAKGINVELDSFQPRTPTKGSLALRKIILTPWSAS